MNNIIAFISLVISMVFVDLGVYTKAQVDRVRNEGSQLQANNLELEQEIKEKGSLFKQVPILLSAEYSALINQVKDLESYSGANMNVQLDGIKDTDDISDNYVRTEYRGVKGLKIKIVVEGISKGIDIGILLDDIHLLEKNTDFLISEISDDNNNLIVKGEVYGI